MKRGDINIFGTSFLDLLSGALAAVIILFVIIPKVSQQQVEVLEEIERLNVQVEELDEMAHRLRDYVPPEVMQELEEQMSVLRNTISDLTYQVEDLQEQLSMAQEENERLHEEVERLSQCCQDSQNLQVELERLREENERIRQENERLQQDNEQMQERLSELEQTQSNEGISDGKVFGIDAVVGITCMWTENIDIDLYVVNVETEEVCFFSHKATPFGNLMEDITSRAAGDGVRQMGDDRLPAGNPRRDGQGLQGPTGHTRQACSRRAPCASRGRRGRQPRVRLRHVPGVPL